MSTTKFGFKAQIRIGDQIVPVASELVTGDSSAQDGVANGFLFKLDRAPGAPPVVINLGDIIAFVENELGAGAGSLANNPGLATVMNAMPGFFNKGSFNAQNGLQIDLDAFVVNSTAKEFLFSIQVDVEGTDPTTGLIPLPAELASWLRIDNVAISFSATSTR